ncbi:MAG TPA: amidohydrolase family protein [Polyangiaceae bacterium]|nr:amidohydrolase family protein [Polyangiaceae bacterium]
MGVLALVLGVGLFASAPRLAKAPFGGARAPRKRLPMVDTHVHLSPGGVPRLLALMKKRGIAHIVNLSGGHPMGALPRQLAEAKTAGGRITVFTGFPYEQAEAPGYGERMARIVRMGHDLGAKGLKITKGLGLGLMKPDGSLMPVDDPELDVVFETAGQLGMPIAIHSGDPRAFWLPVDEKNERFAELSAHPGWSLYGRKVPSFDEIGKQLERRVARHPKTTFISVHFGNCAEDVQRVAGLLRKYPNLYIDTAARIPEMGRHPREELQAFFQEFQDRILYGSDLGIGPEPDPLFLGSSGPNPSTPAEEELFFSATRRFFETSDRAFPGPTPIQGNWTIDAIDLPDSILEKVYSRNAMKLLGIPDPVTPPP